ncbi:MAG TPA: ankyrin repeat domain-containing protein [Ideonella sp.]|nr:ankyrin repeat domain-containing protein [Ideonella sp.]
MRALLDAGVPADQRDAEGSTPLMWAAAYGQVETVRLLLDRHVDVTARDSRGMTALAIALEQQQVQVAEALRRVGARE